MRTGRRIAEAGRLALCFCSCALFSLCVSAQDPELTEEELAAVDSAIGDIEAWLDEASVRHSAEQERLREAELSLATLVSGIETLQAEIAVTEQELEALGERRDALDSQREAQLLEIGDVIRALYRLREQHPLKILLNRDDPGEAARLLHYSRLLTDQQLQRLDRFETTLAELDEIDAALAAELASLSERRRLLDERVLAQEQARAERSAALTALSSEIGRRSAELEQLQLDRAQLEALLEEIARAMEGIRSFDDVPSFAARRGSLPPPATAAVRSRFGSPYADGSLTRQGIILAASPGSAVRAVHAGRVVFADWLRGAGLLVIIDHGEGFVSLYGANEALAVAAGAWVDAGEVIATSGGAGPDGEPGLYFEIRQDGSALDPADWLQPAR